MKNSASHIILIALLTLSVAACSKKDGDSAENSTPAEPVEKLYNDALDKLNEGDYKEATKAFEEVDRQYPYSEWAVRSELMSGFAQYRFGKYDQAVAILEDFVKQHPSHKDAAYAYYLRGMCYYEQITDVGRDQQITEQAKDALEEVVKRYPDSTYARDARLKLDLVSDHLAGKEMEVGRYYEKQQEYISAINRFRVVAEKYQTTSHAPEALHRLVECYLKLGVTEQAKRYAAVLGYNYPNSEWYKDSYALMGGQPLPKEKKKGIKKLWPF
jgi:outer membrane protein assembly factor BamD